MNTLFSGIMMMFFILLFVICNVIVYRQNKLALHDIRGTILFSNMLFFENRLLSNIAALAFIFACLCGGVLEWAREHNSEILKGYIAGGVGFLCLLLHCRFFSEREPASQRGFAFINEFFFAWRWHISSLILILSRVSYLYFLYKILFS